MSEEKSRTEWEREIQEHKCNLCECDPKDHPVYWECPIFENDDICQPCCQIETLRPSVREIFSKRLGRPITLEEINEMCKGCGRNYAKQNEQLADDLEIPEKHNGVEKDEK